jgi:hypothetical protein
VGALAGGLLLHAERYGTEEWSWAKTTAQAFSGTPISYRAFSLARHAFRKEGLMEERASHTRFIDFGEVVARQRFATRFRGTAALWTMAEEHGIPWSEAGAHFRRIRPSDSTDPVQLKALSVTVRGRKPERCRCGIKARSGVCCPP